MSGSAERRAFYRLRYPEAESPCLLFDNNEFHVVEISELGVRICIRRRARLVAGAEIAGWVRFRDGEAVPVEGSVLRVERYEAVIQLTLGISFKRMIDEQRRLIHLYPMLFGT